MTEATDIHPFSEGAVLGLLASQEHLLVQLRNFVGDIVICASADVLNRLAEAVTTLECHDFIGPIHANLVVDALADFLGLTQDRGFASVVIPQVLNLTLIHPVVAQCLTEHLNHVFSGDRFYVSIDLSSTE